MTEARPIRVLLVEDDGLSRGALAAALDDDGIEVVGVADDRATTLYMAHEKQPEVVLLSALGDDVEAARVCAELKSASPDVRVLLFGDAEFTALLAAVESGADGYLSHDATLTRLVSSVRRVAQGEAIVPPRMLGPLLRSLIDRSRDAQRGRELFTRLTKREKEVLELLAEGCDHETVAEILIISPQTARTHIQNVIEKLGVHSRLEAAAVANKHGFFRRATA